MIDQRTHSELLKLMLDNLKYTDDKSPSSFSYDNLSSVAILGEEFQSFIYLMSLYFDIENLEGDDLESRVFQISGLRRKQPTKAYGAVVIKGHPGTRIPQDTQFLSGGVPFSIDRDYTIPEEGSLTVLVTAIDAGPVGNVPAESITKLSPGIPGINRVYNPNAFDNGYYLETDDDLRARYYDKLQNPPKAGNPAHYKLWAEEVDGIGAAKVFRTWKGPSTVKVVIVGMDRTGVDEDMVQKVHDHIMEEAPIHWENLTVSSAEEVKVGIDVKIELRDGYMMEAVRENIAYNIERYLYEVSFRQAFVSYAKIGGAILSADGVLDYEDLKISGEMDNVTLTDTQVGVLGELVVSEYEV